MACKLFDVPTEGLEKAHRLFLTLAQSCSALIITIVGGGFAILLNPGQQATQYISDIAKRVDIGLAKKVSTSRSELNQTPVLLNRPWKVN